MAQYNQQYPQDHPQQFQQYSQEQSQQYQQPPMQHPQQPSSVNAYNSPPAMNANEKPPMQGQANTAGKGSNKWAFGLFDCFSPLSTCCVTFWCPCYIFGKTYERNKSGEKDPSGFNGMCCAYLATLYCGCAPILQCMQRGNTREKHGIEGGLFGDFCTSCCCACCALIQEEKESVVRVTGTDPTTGAVYQPVGQMSYP